MTSKRASRWEDKQCHRTAQAGAPLAASRVELADHATSVTFLHLSCSGATIPKGLVGSYAGQAPDDRPKKKKRPQVSELADLAGGRRIDVLHISIGGNDIGFAKIIQACLAFRSCNKGTRKCVTLPRIFGVLKRPVEAVLRSKCGPSARVLYEKGIDKLDEKYARLAACIQNTGESCEAERVTVRSPRNVIVTGYPDITRGGDGNYCGTSGNNSILQDAIPEAISHFVKRGSKKYRAALAALEGARKLGYLEISGKEAKWAREKVLKGLNKKLAKIAESYGWTYVGDHVGRAKKHGYCAKKTWVRSWGNAKEIQETMGHKAGPSAGSVHPNVKGHHNYRDALLDTFNVLGLPT
jgi:hypothetical protein